MTDKEAMKLALDALESYQSFIQDAHIIEGQWHWIDGADNAITALKERLAQPEQEPVMVLPDGSAFGVMSFPLPDDHWLYAPNEYRDGEHEPIDLPKPVLTRPFRDAVVAAVRYAVRGATMRGQETDFDPDALVQNAVYALCGPYTTPPQRTEQEPVAWPCLIDSADFSANTITLVMQCEDYKVSAGTHWLSTTPLKENQ